MRCPPMTEEVRQGSLAKGIGFLLIAIVFSSLCGTIVRTPLEGFSLFFIFGVQQLVAFIFLMPWFLQEPLSHYTTKVYPLHLIRSLSGIASFLLLYAAIIKIGVAESNTLSYLSPLFIPLIARIWLKEKIAPRIWIALIVGAVGVCFIFPPRLGLMQVAASLAIFSSIASAIAILAIRQISHHEPEKKIIFYYFCHAAVVSLFFVFFFWPEVWNWKFFSVVVLMGVAFVPAQLFLAFAYKEVDPGHIAPFNFSTILFVLFFSWLFYQQIPKFAILAGVVLVLIAGLIASLRLHNK